LRLFNVYGPRQDPVSYYSGVISMFVSRLEHRDPITIYGDGRQVRDFIAVADVVRFFLSAMSVDRVSGEAFNVCTGHGVSVRQLAEILGSVMDVDPQIEHAPARVGDIRVSIGEPSIPSPRGSPGCSLAPRQISGENKSAYVPSKPVSSLTITNSCHCVV